MLCCSSAALAAMIARGPRGALIRGIHPFWPEALRMAGSVRTVLVADSSLVRLCKVSCRKGECGRQNNLTPIMIFRFQLVLKAQ